MLLLFISSILFSVCIHAMETEEQSLVKVTPIKDYPQVALISWRVPVLTSSATFTFFTNLSSGCDPNIKM